MENIIYVKNGNSIKEAQLKARSLKNATVIELHPTTVAFLLFISIYYFLINNDFPVISTGCVIPIVSIKVGTISARHPPSLNV